MKLRCYFIFHLRGDPCFSETVHIPNFMLKVQPKTFFFVGGIAIVCITFLFTWMFYSEENFLFGSRFVWHFTSGFVTSIGIWRNSVGEWALCFQKWSCNNWLYRYLNDGQPKGRVGKMKNGGRLQRNPRKWSAFLFVTLRPTLTLATFSDSFFFSFI